MKLFTATDIANHYKMNVKTAQRWAKAKDWRAKVYKALEKQMIIDLANQVNEIQKG